MTLAYAIYKYDFERLCNANSSRNYADEQLFFLMELIKGTRRKISVKPN